MLKNAGIFFIALALTLAAAYFQRRTGPTHPRFVQFEIENLVATGNLIRSGTTDEDARVELKLNKTQTILPPRLQFRKYKFEESWTEIPFRQQENILFAMLPSLPPAGKYEYRILPPNPQDTSPLVENIVIRFKGAVPATWLVPHIIFMFSAMLLSNLVAVKLIFRQHVSRSWPIAVAAVLGIGGMFLGAFVQKFAFGEYWTGFPFGTDLTDNKTLIALVTWIIAIFVYKKWPRFSLACAFLIMTTVFLIPHSMAGSERDFRTGKIGSSNILPSAPTPQSGDMK